MLVQTAQRQTYVGRARRRSAVACSAALTLFQRGTEACADCTEASVAGQARRRSTVACSAALVLGLRRFPSTATFQGKESRAKNVKTDATLWLRGCRLVTLRPTTEKQLKNATTRKVRSCEEGVNW